MRTIAKYTILVIATALVSVSCRDFLKEQSRTSLPVEDCFVDAKTAESVLFGVYKALANDYVYRWSLSMLLTLPDDEGKPEGSSLVGQRQVCSNAYTTSQAEIESTWKAIYAAVYDANLFIECIRKYSVNWSDADKKLAVVYEAEARTIRALMYFELVRWFKNVPLVTDPEQSKLVAESKARFLQEDPEKVYEFVEKELKWAIDNLSYHSDDRLRASGDCRISKGSAMGLLTKVYATWAGYPLRNTEKWNDCAAVARTLVQSGKHSLLVSWDDLWYNAANNVWAPSEILMEVSFFSPSGTNLTSGRMGKWNGVRSDVGATKWGATTAIFRVHPTLISEWYAAWPNDRRWQKVYADYSYKVTGREYLSSSTVDGKIVPHPLAELLDSDDQQVKNWRKVYSYQLMVGKWDLGRYCNESNMLQDNNYSNSAYYILRYADVLLLYAEALNEINGGPTAEAYKAINMVRRRGFGFHPSQSSSADLSGLSQGQFRNAIRKERSYELCFEGHRRQDLVRWGIYYEAIQERFKSLSTWAEGATDYFLGADYTIKGRHEILPIPQREVDLCGYKQNPEWL